MVFRTTNLSRAVLVALAVATAAIAQTSTPKAAPLRELPQALAEAAALEAEQKWPEALGIYEETLRDFPNDGNLQHRYNVARHHASLERRYADESFVNQLQTLDNAGAQQLLNELLLKIESHYVVNPPWAEIAAQGVIDLEIAASDPTFRTRNALRADVPQLQQLSADMRQEYAARGAVASREQLLAFVNRIAQLAANRVGVSQVATTLEFTAAAANALDNYSSFLTPDQLREVYSQIEGNFVGLGVELKPADGALAIVRVIPTSPADRAGIVAGERITAVDGKPTAEYSTDEAAAMLTGAEGSTVSVRVESPTLAPRDLNIRREHVDVPSLEGVNIVDKDYGVAYVRVPVFQKSTSRDLEAALWDLHRQGMRSLVIDLRGNPGGLLTAAVELADKFVAQGNIVSTRGRSDGEDFDYRAHRAGTWRVPLVVLIDGDSASASEIFAAAIHDNRRGTLVGDRSFGKGSVQGIFPLGSTGAGIRLTTAKFYSPNGDPISKVGVSPDIVVRRATSVAGGRVEVGFRGVAGQSAGAEQLADEALVQAISTARTQVAMPDSGNQVR